MNSSLSCQIDNSQVYLKGDMENYWDATKGYIESHTSCLEDQHSCPGPTLIMIDDSRASKEDCDVLHIMKTISFSIQGLMVVLIMWTEHRGFVHTVHRHLLPLAAGYYPRNRDRDTRLSSPHVFIHLMDPEFWCLSENKHEGVSMIRSQTVCLDPLSNIQHLTTNFLGWCAQTHDVQFACSHPL